MKTIKRRFIALNEILFLALIFGCATMSSQQQGVQQEGEVTSNPPSAQIFIVGGSSDKWQTPVGITPTRVALVNRPENSWSLMAKLKGYETERWLLPTDTSDISHHFELKETQETKRLRKEKELLTEEERRKQEEERLKRAEELLAKLKEIQEKFEPYGFDVLGFVNYAKSALRTRGDIDFGGAVPMIDFRTFKGKNYVEIKINYLVTYNTLKVSMYESASMTFDEIVKKLAKKIVTDFKNRDNIAGFIFNITYTNKDFLEKYDVPRLVTNEFILPKDACHKYANLDITNQDLINQSIVLVDGERISLNLQISR